MGLLLMKTFASLAGLAIVYGLWKVLRYVWREADVAPVIYNMTGFEWKPAEEVGKLIHTSNNQDLVAFVDECYAKRSALQARNSREDFCKNMVWDWTQMLVLDGLLEIESEYVDIEWLQKNTHIARRLETRDLLRFRFLVEELRKQYGDVARGLADILAHGNPVDAAQATDSPVVVDARPPLAPRSSIILLRKTGRGRPRRSKKFMQGRMREAFHGAP